MDNRVSFESLQTARELVLYAAGQFDQANLHFGHGTDNPHDEAVYLVFGVLGYAFDIAEEALDRPLPARDRERVREVIQQRLENRKPTAYLLGEAWFCGLPFLVNEHVLVPRSPFAELIHDRFQPWLDREPKTILDIGTGSGCIGIACACAFPEAEVDAVDISEQALEVAQKNIERHCLTERMRLFKSDIFAGLPSCKYDLIVSNPPYVSQADIDALPAEYSHEPVLGLEGGGDGLDIVRRILQQAKAYLADDGLLIVEVGLMQKTLDQTMPDLPFTWLEFEHGGEGVFLLAARDLQENSPFKSQTLDNNQLRNE